MELKAWKHREFLDATFPISPILGGNLLDMGEKMVLYGPSESGKSYLADQLALELATGGNFFGFEVLREGLRVEIFQAEVSVPRYQERHAKLSANYRGDPDLWVTTTEELKLDTVEGAEALKSHLEVVRPHVIVLDPMRAFFGGDENSSEDVERWFTGLAYARGEMQASVIYVHHVRKEMAGGGDEGGGKASARGSGLIIDRPSTALALTVNEAQTAWTLTFRKSRNRNKRPEPVKLRANFESGLFESDVELDLSGLYVSSIMVMLADGPMAQAEVQRRVAREWGVNPRTVYDWIMVAERRELLRRERRGGPGSPWTLEGVGGVDTGKELG